MTSNFFTNSNFEQNLNHNLIQNSDSIIPLKVSLLSIIKRVLIPPSSISQGNSSSSWKKDPQTSMNPDYNRDDMSSHLDINLNASLKADLNIFSNISTNQRSNLTMDIHTNGNTSLNTSLNTGLVLVSDSCNALQELFSLISKYSFQQVVLEMLNVIDDFVVPVLNLSGYNVSNQNGHFNGLFQKKNGYIPEGLLEQDSMEDTTFHSPIVQSLQIAESSLIILYVMLDQFSFAIMRDQVTSLIDEMLSKLKRMNDVITDGDGLNSFHALNYFTPDQKMMGQAYIHFDGSLPHRFFVFERFSKLLMRCLVSLLQQIDKVAHDSESPYAEYISRVYELISNQCFPRMPRFILYFLKESFSILYRFATESHIENMLTVCIQNHNIEALEFLLFLMSNMDELGQINQIFDPMHCQNWNSLINKSVQQIISLFKRQDKRISEQFIKVTMEIFNEYVTFDLEHSTVSTLLVLVMELFGNATYSNDLRCHIMNTLFSNIIPSYPDIVLQNNLFEVSIQLCLHFMSESRENFQRGLELLEVSFSSMNGKKIFHRCLSVAEIVLSSKETAPLMKMAGLGVIRCISTNPKNYSLVASNGKYILSMLEQSLVSGVERVKREALLTLCKSIHILRDISYLHFKSLIDSMLGALQFSDAELQHTILESIAIIDFNLFIPTDKREVHESVPTKIVLHLIRHFSISNDPKTQYEILSCISTVIGQFIQFDWHGSSDQIVSFFVKVLQINKRSTYQFQLKRIAIECIENACGAISKEKTKIYFPEIMKEFELLVLKNQDLEILDSILSFFGCMIQVMKSDVNQFFPFIFKIIHHTMTISEEERVTMKKLKVSNLHSRIQERCAALQALNIILRDVPFRCIQRYINPLIDVLSHFVVDSQKYNHDKLRTYFLDCVANLFLYIQNNNQISGKRKVLHERGNGTKKRRVGDVNENRYVQFASVTNVEQQTEGSQYGHYRYELLLRASSLLVQYLESIFCENGSSLEIRVCGLNCLHTLSCNLSIESLNIVRGGLIQCIYGILSSNFISDLRPIEQISSTARLLEICQNFHCLPSLKEALMRLSVNVMTFITMEKMICQGNESDIFDFDLMDSEMDIDKSWRKGVHRGVADSDYRMKMNLEVNESDRQKSDLQLVQSFAMGELY